VDAEGDPGQRNLDHPERFLRGAGSAEGGLCGSFGATTGRTVLDACSRRPSAVWGRVRKDAGGETFIPGFSFDPHPLTAASTLAQRKSMLSVSIIISGTTMLSGARSAGKNAVGLRRVQEDAGDGTPRPRFRCLTPPPPCVSLLAQTQSML
jgi:hypothetical protein